VAVQFLISSAVKKSLLGSKLTYRHIYSASIYRSFGALNLILPTQDSKSWTKGQNYRDFRDLFSCTFLTKNFPEIGYFLSFCPKPDLLTGNPATG
jgi:hypothetical protein